MKRRVVLATVAAAVASLAIAGPALAHIHTDPSEAQAGATETVGFIIGHGCDGSPTIEVAVQVPDGVVDATPEPLEGWDVDVDEEERVVTFSGGELPDGDEGVFEITMTLPPTPDTTIYFPMVQTCEVGQYHWIGIPGDDGEEPDEPAPALALIGPVASTTLPVTTDPAPTDGGTADTAAPESTDAAVDPTVPAASDTTSPATSVADDEGGSSNTGTIVFIVTVIAVLLVGALAVAAARSKRAGGDAEGGPGDAPTS